MAGFRRQRASPDVGITQFGFGTFISSATRAARSAVEELAALMHIRTRSKRRPVQPSETERSLDLAFAPAHGATLGMHHGKLDSQVHRLTVHQRDGVKDPGFDMGDFILARIAGRTLNTVSMRSDNSNIYRPKKIKADILFPFFN